MALTTVKGSVLDPSENIYTPAGTGAVATNVKAKLDERVSVKDFGATGDGVTDDITELELADAQTGANHVHVPKGTYVTTAAASTFSKVFSGEGHLEVSGQDRGNIFSYIDAEQTAATGTSWTNQFDGDNSKAPWQLDVQYEATVSDPFGAEGTSYVYRPEIIPVFNQLRVGAGVGFNSATAGNGPGRTGAVVQRNKVSHIGQGDAACYNAEAFVSGTKAGATDWLAQPAAVLYNGSMSAGANYVYLNCTEFRLTGSTYDCAAIGAVYNLERDTARSAQNTYWGGVVIQSQGTASVDDGMFMAGDMKYPINLVRATSTSAAIVMAQDHKIAFDGSSGGDSYNTTVGTTYISFNGTTLVTRVAGINTFSASSTSVTLTTNVQLNLTGSGGVINYPTAATAAAAGAGVGALPATPEAFINIKVGGTSYKIPYYPVS